MSIHIAQHPLVGMILRQVDRPWDRFKVVSVASGTHRFIWWVTPGEHNFAGSIQSKQGDMELFEIDPDQTDGPIDRPMPSGKLPPRPLLIKED